VLCLVFKDSDLVLIFLKQLSFGSEGLVLLLKPRRALGFLIEQVL